MNNEWLNTLRRRMDDHEEDIPEGLWNDIKDELFSEKNENNIITDPVPVVNNESEEQKNIRSKTGNRPLFYRIGSIAAAILLLFLMIKLWPENSQDKALSQRPADLEKEAGRNIVLENTETQNNSGTEGRAGFEAPLAHDKFNTVIAENTLKINFKNVLKREGGIDIQGIGHAPDIETLFSQKNITPQVNSNTNELMQETDNEKTDQALFKYRESKEKYAENTRHKASKSQPEKSWMVSMLTGNASSNSAEQQFPGYASISGEPMNIEEVWSTSSYEDNPLTEILLANQSWPVEARIRHKIPVTLGLSLYYNVGKKWGIGTGLNYTKLASELHSGSDANYIKGAQMVHYIGIPVQVNYNVIQKGRFTGYVTGGALVEKPVSGSITTTYVVNDEIKETSKERLDHKPLQFSVNTAVGLQLKVIEKLGIYAEPGIGYHFKDENAPNTIYKEKPLHFNLKFGVRLLID